MGAPDLGFFSNGWATLTMEQFTHKLLFESVSRIEGNGGMEMIKMHRPRWLAAVILFALAACATPNREGAALIAKTGQQVASALELEATSAADAANRMVDQYILTTVIVTCARFTGDDACASPEVAVVGNFVTNVDNIRARLSERAKVFAAMREAYRALELEATYDGAGDLSGALKGLATSLASYAVVANVSVGPPAEFLIGSGSGLLGQIIGANQQSRRLDEANRVLAVALDQTISLVEADRESVGILLRTASIDRKTFLAALIKAGVVPGYAAIYRNALPLGTVAIADSQEAVIRNNRALRLAAERLMAENLARPDETLMRNYDLLVASLRVLREEHRSFLSRKSPNLEQLTSALNAAAQAVKKWNELNSQPKPQQ